MQSSKEAAAFGFTQQYVHLNTLLLFRILAESLAFGSLRGYCTEDIFLYLVTPDFLINISSVKCTLHFSYSIFSYVQFSGRHYAQITCECWLAMASLISTISSVPVARDFLITMPLISIQQRSFCAISWHPVSLG